MKKYDSNNKLLGILKLSAPRPLYLNRPFITILEQLGVESNVFVSMLMKELKTLAFSMLCECNAVKLLQDSSTLGIPYRKLYKSGIPFLSEPIFRQIVDCVIHHRINELRLKAKIKIPINCGRTVFGVLDETNTLNYGEVFVQLSYVDEDGMSKDKCFILEDEIMVTKFPCSHPGDVRKFKAVDIPKLHHIKDCIVFPAKGQRPHPNEMAGSDLDGDEYAVVWNPDLIFKGENRKAMDFPTPDSKILPKDAEVEDILDFYCDYILSNNIGLLANAHLANADLEEKGIFSEKCMSLAKKCAVALDFAKTGIVERIHWFVFSKYF
jgi:RNA-dependent RNA polymerase